MFYTLEQQNEIWNFYFQGYDSRKTYTNPLRRDKTPSCYFSQISTSFGNNVINFIDWGYKPTHIDCILFVALSYNIDELEAIRRINIDLKYTSKLKGGFNVLEKERVVTPSLISIPEKERNVFDTSKRREEFKDYEIEYWNQFNINLNILKKYEVYPVDWVFKNESILYSASKYNPVFAYYENNKLFKIYNPLGNKFYKWRTIKALLEGYSKLEYKSNVLFITSSLKDVMCLSSLNYDSFALPSENSYKILLPIIKDLFKDYEYIFLYLNNDDTGKSYSKYLTLEIDKRLKYINNPDSLPSDPSDIIKKYNTVLLNDIINNKLERDKVKLIWK